MIRPNNGQRMGGKPPPPVPPRPSKSIVAEALAKSRQFKSPTRQAPPPPPVTGVNEIVKSKSSYAVNIPLKKPTVFERSISEEVKNQGRPVIYQSPNVKCNTLDSKSGVSIKSANYVNHCINNLTHSVINNFNNGIKNAVSCDEVKVKNSENNITNIVNVNSNSFNNNKVKITRKSSDVITVSRSNSLRNSNKSEEIPVPKPRSDPLKRNSYCGDKFVEKIVEIQDNSFEIKKDEVFDYSKSNSSTLEKSCDSSTTSSSRSSNSTVDKKNWDQMLNDRNHVNTLIDEMFASVLEISPPYDDEENNQDQEGGINDGERGSSVTVPQDSTKIIVRSDSKEKVFQESPLNAIPQDNKVVISNSLSDRSCSSSVTSTEMLPKTVIVIKNGDDSTDDNVSIDSVTRDHSGSGSNYNSAERAKQQVKFKDQQNHELLINELQCMKRDQEKILKRQRKPSMDIYDNDENGSVKSDNGYVESNNVSPKIRRPDTLNINGSGEREVKIKTKFILDKDNKGDHSPLRGENERLSAMSSLQHGLPPLPKSLSGFNLTAPNHHPPTPPRSSSIRAGGLPSGHSVYQSHPAKPTDLLGTGAKKTTGLDAKLAILRQEMYSLRQLDLSLLSQLWSLNESIQDFRQMLQEQEERVLSPPSPSPTPSSGDEEFYVSATSLNFRPGSVTTQTSGLIRRQSTSSNASSMGG